MTVARAGVAFVAPRRIITGEVFLVNGPRASGRSTVARLLGGLQQKLSTRPARTDDTGALTISPRVFTLRQEHGEFITYQHGGHWYGIDMPTLDDHLGRHAVASVILSDEPTIELLPTLYPHVRFHRVFVWASVNTCEHRLRDAGWPDAAISARIGTATRTLQSFATRPELYDAVVLNEFGRAALERQVRAIQSRFSERKECI